MKQYFLLAVLLLTSCQANTLSHFNQSINYTESSVTPITSPVVIKYRPFYNADRINDETIILVGKSGDEKTISDRVEGKANLTAVGKNLLYQTKFEAEGQEFTLNMLLTEYGEILETTFSSADSAASRKAKKDFSAFENAIKTYSVKYPAEGIKSGDELFADKGEVRLGTLDMRVKIKGKVKGLVQSRGRPSVLVDLTGSYMVMATNPKAYLNGWMLLDVNTGVATRMSSRAVVHTPRHEVIDKLLMAASSEIRLPQLSSTQNTNLSEKQFYLDLAWEKLLVGREVFPVMVRQTGRVGYVKSASLIGGKKCDAVFRYDQTGQGDWEVNCTDGTRAVGVLQTLGRGKGSKGSGFDANGNKIDFRIRHEIAE
jgi:hypothetical protein|tara:strand:+ start:914 stop:2023 length:1110 start_codon:yes stop_codon:yes gene_type:complete